MGRFIKTWSSSYRYLLSPGIFLVQYFWKCVIYIFSFPQTHHLVGITKRPTVQFQVGNDIYTFHLDLFLILISKYDFLKPVAPLLYDELCHLRDDNDELICKEFTVSIFEFCKDISTLFKHDYEKLNFMYFFSKHFSHFFFPQFISVVHAFLICKYWNFYVFQLLTQQEKKKIYLHTCIYWIRTCLLDLCCITLFIICVMFFGFLYTCIFSIGIYAILFFIDSYFTLLVGLRCIVYFIGLALCYIFVDNVFSIYVFIFIILNFVRLQILVAWLHVVKPWHGRLDLYEM